MPESVEESLARTGTLYLHRAEKLAVEKIADQTGLKPMQIARLLVNEALRAREENNASRG